MKPILLIILLTSSTFLLGQSREEGESDKITLSGKFFKSNGSCFEVEDKTQYEVYEYEKEVNTFDWGHFISFTDDSFSTSYSAPCGNDCFTSVSGTYKYVSANKIEVYVASISRSGFCQEKSEEPKKVYGMYAMEQTATGIIFRKDQK
jgi:hypothetical protein